MVHANLKDSTDEATKLFILPVSLFPQGVHRCHDVFARSMASRQARLFVTVVVMRIIDTHTRGHLIQCGWFHVHPNDKDSVAFAPHIPVLYELCSTSDRSSIMGAGNAAGSDDSRMRATARYAIRHTKRSD